MPIGVDIVDWFHCFSLLHKNSRFQGLSNFHKGSNVVQARYLLNDPLHLQLSEREKGKMQVSKPSRKLSLTAQATCSYFGGVFELSNVSTGVHSWKLEKAM